MSIDTKSRHVTSVGGNIFADLGFEPEEAARLLAETDRVISEKLASLADLTEEDSKKLTDLFTQHGVTPAPENDPCVGKD